MRRTTNSSNKVLIKSALGVSLVAWLLSLAPVSVLARSPAVVPSQVLQDLPQQDIDWQSTPASLWETPHQRPVVWAGRITQIHTKTRQAATDGARYIEFVCQWYPLQNASPAGLELPLRLSVPEKNTAKEVRFVISLTSEQLQPRHLRKMQQDLLQRPHYVLISAVYQQHGYVDNQPALFMQMGRSFIGDARYLPISLSRRAP
ncbi:hypothetical protein [Parvibium lacunae]|uniref:Uncharacterized protein n=1 Tax=Parvibium lacunae TaxID=1888893 RepID=A0A368KYG5_9BURK|nr:hypothetical protein [Parvibium lacunae]RCS56488.1 hypothetical protein DU000_12240 [Parvibium lacunae]